MGGHSPFGPSYGLGADVALEYKVVIPSGELVVANAQTNPDLFWALRGGGGGTYGIVTEATVKAFPTPKIYGSIFEINATNWQNPPDSYWDMVAELHKQLPILSQQGVSGFYYIYPATTLLMLISSGEQGPNLKGIANALAKKLSSFPGMKKRGVLSSSMDSYKKFFDAEFTPIDGGKISMSQSLLLKYGNLFFKRDELPDAFHEAPEGIRPSLHRRMNMETAEPNGHEYMDSRLLGARHFQNPNLAQLLKKSMPPTQFGQLRGNFIAGREVSKDNPDTSVNPAWRTALTHLIGTGYPGNWTVNGLRELAPDSGAYGNEVNFVLSCLCPKVPFDTNLARHLPTNPTGRMLSGAPTTTNSSR
jgi:hypothetical protein